MFCDVYVFFESQQLVAPVLCHWFWCWWYCNKQDPVTVPCLHRDMLVGDMVGKAKQVNAGAFYVFLFLFFKYSLCFRAVLGSQQV